LADATDATLGQIKSASVCPIDTVNSIGGTTHDLQSH
jgi:hypothetical protein